MEDDAVIKVLLMYEVISPNPDETRCILKYIEMGGEITDYVQAYIDKGKLSLAKWMEDRGVVTPPPSKRKYTRRNLNPELGNEENNTIKVYCEGTCSNIGKPNAIAAYSVFAHITSDGEVFSREVTSRLDEDEQKSNQRAELRALHVGTKVASELETEFPKCNIEIIISSLYVYRCITEWLDMWKKKDWKDVRHSDILTTLSDTQIPCRLIKKNSTLPGYVYARLAAIKSTEDSD